MLGCDVLAGIHPELLVRQTLLWWIFKKYANIKFNHSNNISSILYSFPKHWFKSMAETITNHNSTLWYFFLYVPRLYTLGGRPVCGPAELENNQHYVAVGAEKFKALQYDQCVPRDLIRENNMTEGYETFDASEFLGLYLHKSKVCLAVFCFPFCLCSQDSLPAIRKTRHAKDVVSTIASEFFLNSS